MVRGVLLAGLLVLLCQHMLVMAHVLGRPYSATSMAKLKSLLQQFEETLAAEETASSPVDYEDVNPAADQSLVAPAWDREAQRPLSQEGSPQDGVEAQRNRLLDLLMGTRSKSCFGARLDRIGSSSGLGCNAKRG